MVALSEAIAVLYPNAVIGSLSPAQGGTADVVLAGNGSGDSSILYWNAALGPQPTQAQLDAVTQAQVDAAKAVKRRAAASAIFGRDDGDGQILRAVVLTLVDEVNLLRQRLAAQDAVVAAATSLANLKSDWATMASARPVPDRTPVQAKNAIAAKLNSGGAD